LKSVNGKIHSCAYDNIVNNKPNCPLSGSFLVLDPVPICSQRKLGRQIESENINSPDPLDCSAYRCILFGGHNETSIDIDTINDVYFLIIDDISCPVHIEWKKIDAIGDKPSPRCAHSCNFIGRNMFVFGGWTSSAKTTETELKNAMKIDYDVFLNDLYVIA
jgi:hypothetical protein